MTDTPRPPVMISGALCTKGCTSHNRWGHRHEDGEFITLGEAAELTVKVLDAYAAVDGHRSMSGLDRKILGLPLLPQRFRHDRRTRAGKALMAEVVLIQCIAWDLALAGLLEQVEEVCRGFDDDGAEFSWGMAVTDAGRAALLLARGMAEEAAR